jgi:hypothetical protein
MCGVYLPIPGFEQVVAVSPVKQDGCLPPHTAQEERPVHIRGNLIPEIIHRGQDAARGLPVKVQVKNHL